MPIPGTSLTVLRNGKFRHEFLLQRGLARISHASGEVSLLGLFEEPIGLRRGKKAWNVFQATCDWMPTLRSLGHTGIYTNLYLADGALFTALDRKFKARRKFYYRCGNDFGTYSMFLELADITIGIKCSSHACSNGIKWG